MPLPLFTINWITFVADLAGCGKKEEPRKDETDPRSITIAPPSKLNPGEVRKDALPPSQSGRVIFEIQRKD